MDKPIKRIADQKLKAFAIGSMGNRTLSKREQEELKKKEQEHAAAQAFEEFVATFDNAPTSKVSKTWIKAGTYDAGKRQEDSKDKGKIYRPKPKMETEKTSAQQAEEYAKQLNDKRASERPKKKKEGEKRKTNLELFKEELKMIQEEREERHKYKNVVKSAVDEPEIARGLSLEDVKGSYDTGDPTTTNLYLGNLNPKITEQQLMELFGKYGPLASIKIMWPRSEEEKARGRNCGFVAYMSRKDGERALRCLNGKDVMQYEMKLGWGKGVPLPPNPIYVPPKMMALTMPPPDSGMPFNAQPPSRERNRIPNYQPREELPPDEELRLRKISYNSVVKVVVPVDRNLLMLVHHMIEFVIREGPMFEAMIMNKEINNPMFSFLFDNQSPTHIYYRWKLFSMLQGDNAREWRTDEFRMFKGGSIWRPPPISPFSSGMPDELFEDDLDVRKGSLSVTQRERLEELLRNITPERVKVAEAMIFCVEHVDAAEEICDCILDSLSNSSTLLFKKVGRLYLVSDILHNCLNKYSNASYFRIVFQSRLMKIFEEVHKTLQGMEDQKKIDAFRTRILHVFKAWSDMCIYPKDVLTRLENIFLGLSPTHQAEVESSDTDEEEEKKDSTAVVSSSNAIYTDDDIDGAPLSEQGEDIDGVPLDGAALLKAMKQADTDIDGVPLEEDIDGIPLEDEAAQRKEKAAVDRSAAFVPSRWESVDPEEAEAQAMTTSKWEMLESKNAQKPDSSSSHVDDGSNSPKSANQSSVISESVNEDDRRAKLREVEVKVMQYQDELESGKRAIKSGVTVSQQVEHYRKKLLRKIEKQKLEKKDKERGRDRRSSSYDEHSGVSRRSKRSRSISVSPTHGRKSRRSRSQNGSCSPEYSRSQRTWSPASSYKSVSKRRPSSPSPKRKRRSPDTPVRSKYQDSASPSGHSRHRSKRSESNSPPHSRHSRHSPRGRSSSPLSLKRVKHKHRY